MPPREYALNAIGRHIPLVRARLWFYGLFGVRFEDPATTSLMMACWIHAPREIFIGARSSIGPHCFLDGRGGITIGRDVNVSGYARLVTGTHDPHSPTFAGRLAPVVLRDRVWIATGATVLAGVTMEEGSVAAAGAVVVKDVAPFTIVAGVPARPVAERPADLSYQLSFREDWR
jgi:acetyltransferase-like isoleucine patch superfamily enzyme